MTNQLEIKLLSENATMPKRDRLDAGYDIYSAETLILEPQEKAVIKTDVAVNIPEGYVGLLTSRSGVSSKTHLVIETGKIDAGFQGNMKINIKNDIELTTSDEYVYEDIKGKIIDDEEFNKPLDKQNLSPLEKFELRNTSYVIKKGDKLAQLVIVPIFTPKLTEVDEFNTESERGTDGFGSTGY
ncbi:dUTP pyrophosphatase [Staphylococcus warneri]|uniref:dUTP diphosphatase n=1 Tax=Staphylococcus warneri TaxID=1292 RepID=UPI001FB3F8C8|nr:dUTP pyrophosphatase [Staphylococcus warneri]MCJ1787191.1 dUTP pyrophosphatase [Staphylococcus warneri]MCJ1799488.1 dUTP pyrophosphatase [Staphylococcus warneri]